MIGEASGLAPDRGLNILYRVSMNTLMNLTDADLTQVNYSTAVPQQLANTRLSANTPKGLLAGSVVMAGTVAGTVVACDASHQPLGVVINNAVGYPFESSSGVASGKCPYLHGSGTVFTTDLYETAEVGGAALIIPYAAGVLLYSSVNGLITTVAGTLAIGVCLIAPSASDPFMVVQMRI
jgi:hypothetical protein